MSDHLRCIQKKYKKLPKVSFKKAIRGNKRKAEDTPIRPAKVHVDLDPESSGSLRGSRRRSARIQGKDVPSESELKEEVDQWNDENEAPVKVTPNRPNFYGAVPGVEIGTIWATRVECCRDGIHRPTVAGIHAGQDGAYSIALSGGYEDNVDLGECFTYTGEGGRDLKGTASNPKNLRTAPQSKDQTLTRGNLALSRNVETGNPVRVIRGYKLQQFSPFAPEEGYRYDGLYTVEKFWSTVGISGFVVWKFALRRCTDQPPPPWTFIETDGQSTTSEGAKSDSGFDSDETASQTTSSQSSVQSNEQVKEENMGENNEETNIETGSEKNSSQSSAHDDEIQDEEKLDVDEKKTDEKQIETDKRTDTEVKSNEKNESVTEDKGEGKKDDDAKNENEVNKREDNSGDRMGSENIQGKATKVIGDESSGVMEETKTVEIENCSDSQGNEKETDEMEPANVG